MNKLKETFEDHKKLKSIVIIPLYDNSIKLLGFLFCVFLLNSFIFFVMDSGVTMLEIKYDEICGKTQPNLNCLVLL